MALLPVGYRVSSLAANGLPFGLGAVPAGGPVIQLEFTLPIAGPVTADLDSCLPQQCQEENPNIQLVVYVVDHEGNPVNLMAASAKQIRLQCPDGTTKLVTANFLTSGVDGALEYTTTDEDLPQAGTYQLQASFTIGGNTQTTRRAKFRAGANIDES